MILQLAIRVKMKHMVQNWHVLRSIRVKLQNNGDENTEEGGNYFDWAVY